MDVLTTMLFARAAYRAAYTPPAIGSGNALRAQNIANQTEARLDRALLTMEAMWILMREHLDVTDEKLRALITEIDLSDGRIDGRARRSVPKLQPHDLPTLSALHVLRRRRPARSVFVACLAEAGCGAPLRMWHS